MAERVEKNFLQKAENCAIIETEVKKEMGDAWHDFRVSSGFAAVMCTLRHTLPKNEILAILTFRLCPIGAMAERYGIPKGCYPFGGGMGAEPP